MDIALMHDKHHQFTRAALLKPRDRLVVYTMSNTKVNFCLREFDDSRETAAAIAGNWH